MKLPAFVLPRPVAAVVRALPRTPPSVGLAVALNLAKGRLFPADALALLTGRRIALEVSDAGLLMTVTLTPRGFEPADDAVAPADVTISAGAYEFIALALRTEDPDSLFFSRRLRIEGDTELGLLVKNTLDAVDFSTLLPPLGPFARWAPGRAGPHR
jgi:predicted lipid carrier protein YhbT